MNKVVKCTAAIALAALIAACGNGNNTSTPTNLRFVNATRSAALSVTLNQTGQFANIAAGTATGYAQITPADYAIAVTAGNASLATSTQTLGLASGQTYTLLAYERDGAILALLIIEDQSTPPTGYATFEVSNSSPDPGNLDVYVVSPGASLTGLSPSFSNLNYGSAPVATSLVAGTYDIVATAQGSQSDIRSRLPSVTVSAGEILMAAYTSTSGGALVNSVLLAQGGSVSFAPTTQARVRAIAAMTGSSPVVATVGSTTLAPVYPLPVTGGYAQVTGGTSSYSLTVGGTAVAGLPAATFAAGGDFTILVYGSASSPVVSVLADNNQSPIGSEVNLRLVNAATSVAGGLTLLVNNSEVALSVGYGQASAYVGVTGQANSSLQAVAPGQAGTALSSVQLTIPDAVYSVFVVDPTTLTPILIRDR